eukprot:c3976_g1_i1.p1 GENE.c3976_g1_i1~~c3976_g1_i1.p1  ORF type:complete len:748 (-),score=207.30 c3976_g1_i1:481-2724(-)
MGEISRPPMRSHTEVGVGPPPAVNMVPVTVLCGFLGSGKTSLLQHILLNKENMRIAVLVNDMASVNVDAAVTRKGVDPQDVAELQNGCICCQLSGELISQVNALASRVPPPAGVVVESSGIAQPSRIAAAFDKAQNKTAVLDTVVTVVDGTRIVSDMMSREVVGNRPDWVKVERTTKSDATQIVDLLVEQIEYADVVLLNKCDMISEQQKTAALQLIRNLNPTCRVLESSFGRVGLKEIMHTSLYKPNRQVLSSVSPENVSSIIASMGSFVYRTTRLMHPVRLQGLVSGWSSERVLRSKGYVSVAASPSPHRYYWSHAGRILQLQHPPKFSDWDDNRGPDAPTAEIVFIGHSVHESVITQLLDDCALTCDEEKETFPPSCVVKAVQDPGEKQQELESQLKHHWFKIAVVLGVITVLWNIAEGVASIQLGISDEAVSLYVFGIDSIIEVLSALVVLFRLYSTRASFLPNSDAPPSPISPALVARQQQHELYSAFAINLLLIGLVIASITSSTISLVKHKHLDTSVPGLGIGAFSLIFMCLLYFTKVKAAVMLNSKVLAADASCSLACCLLSFVLFAGSLVCLILPSLWFVDPITAIVIAVVIFRDAAHSLHSLWHRFALLHHQHQSQSPQQWPQQDAVMELCCGSNSFDLRIYRMFYNSTYTAAGSLRATVIKAKPEPASASPKAKLRSVVVPINNSSAATVLVDVDALLAAEDERVALANAAAALAAASSSAAPTPATEAPSCAKRA